LNKSHLSPRKRPRFRKLAADLSELLDNQELDLSYSFCLHTRFIFFLCPVCRLKNDTDFVNLLVSSPMCPGEFLLLSSFPVNVYKSVCLRKLPWASVLPRKFEQTCLFAQRQLPHELIIGTRGSAYPYPSSNRSVFFVHLFRPPSFLLSNAALGKRHISGRLSFL